MSVKGTTYLIQTLTSDGTSNSQITQLQHNYYAETVQTLRYVVINQVQLRIILATLKRKDRHIDDCFITGYTGCCRDNLWCSQWWKNVVNMTKFLFPWMTLMTNLYFQRHHLINILSPLFHPMFQDADFFQSYLFFGFSRIQHSMFQICENKRKIITSYKIEETQPIK